MIHWPGTGGDVEDEDNGEQRGMCDDEQWMAAGVRRVANVLHCACPGWRFPTAPEAELREKEMQSRRLPASASSFSISASIYNVFELSRPRANLNANVRSATSPRLGHGDF
jgi:hypothetical protein